MNNKSQYNTKQHEEILEYLKSIRGEHVTARDVYRHMLEEAAGDEASTNKCCDDARTDGDNTSSGLQLTNPADEQSVDTAAAQTAGATVPQSARRKIGQATVYRQLERLVEEGLVEKYIIDQNSPACFEYIGNDECGEGLCVHGKCLKCGRIFHLHCDEIKELEDHLKAHHGFTPDFHHTVIYGICDQCAAKC